MEQLRTPPKNGCVGWWVYTLWALGMFCTQADAQWNSPTRGGAEVTPLEGTARIPRSVESPTNEPFAGFGLDNSGREPPVDESAFGFGNPLESGRHLGLGDPLVGTSWRNRPYHVGWMVGCLVGDELVNGRVDQHTNIVGGYRLGWDVDHYWGIEGRFVFANLDFIDVVDPTVSRTCENHYWDVDFVYFPWGDSRWRPYGSVGVGWASFEYRDALGQEVEKSLFALPWGAGVKYYWKNWLALRLSVMDNWAIGQGPLSTMHNVSLTGDVEIRFGGCRTSYFPYSSGMHFW